MSQRVSTSLVVTALVLLVGVVGFGTYVIGTAPAAEAGPAAGTAGTAPVGGSNRTAEPLFFKTKNFRTDLADKDQLRYADLTVALALKDTIAMDTVKRLEPQIRDIILGRLRQHVAADLAGATGKEMLAAEIQNALTDLVKDSLQKVYITDLVVQ